MTHHSQLVRCLKVATGLLIVATIGWAVLVAFNQQFPAVFSLLWPDDEGDFDEEVDEQHRRDQQRALERRRDNIRQHLSSLQRMSAVELFDAYDTAKKDVRFHEDGSVLKKEHVLTETIRRGDKECEPLLMQRLHKAIRPTEHLQLLTALRRVQKKCDPLIVEVTLPAAKRADTRELPTIRVSLTNADEDKKLVTVKHGGDYRSGRLARWRIEVHDSVGRLLPERPRAARMGGGMYHEGTMAYGQSWNAVLPMDDYVKITEAGEYTVRVLYHDEETIADFDDVTGLIMSTSKTFALRVVKAPPKIIEVTGGSTVRARKCVGMLKERGPIRWVCGKCDENCRDFLDPESAEGQLQAMGWNAVPGLLAALRNDHLSAHKRGWVLALLYVITGERDLNPLCWRTGSEVLPKYEYRGIGCYGSGGGRPNIKKQRQFAEQWLKLAV